MQRTSSPSAQMFARRLAGLSRHPLARAGLALLVVAAVAMMIPALRWRRIQSDKTFCQTNLRRLSIALRLYAQDYDYCLPPPDFQAPGVGWRTWVDLLEPYGISEALTVCPANPAEGARNPYFNYPYPHGYALNVRFFGLFGPGPFPIENLEMPAQTALLVEGGWFRAKGPFGQPTYPWAMSWYWDTAWWPNVYPSPHDGRMNVTAADGHVINVKVAHYSPAGHDALYGRFGGSIYNWNGGHPNGGTDGPPQE